MHKGRVRQVRAAILRSDKQGLFDMRKPAQANGLSPKKCGTIGCIAGHAAAEFTTLREAERLYTWWGARHGDTFNGWPRIGALLLDIPMREATSLFYGRGFGGLHASAQQAAQALDTLLAQPSVGHYDGPIPPGALGKLYKKGRA